MNLGPLALVALFLLAAPAGLRAAVVYYGAPESNGIESVTGTIARETDDLVEITTADGRTISIPRADVYQIIRDEPARATPAIDASSALPEPTLLEREASKPKRRDHYGVKGGMSFSNLSVDPQELEEGGSLHSFAVGAWWGIPVHRRVTFQTEAMYSVKGDAEEVGGTTASTRMSYIDVPVLAKIGFLHRGAAKPSFVVGPSFGVNLSAQSTLEGEGGTIEVDVKDQTRTFDFGVVVGGGVDFSVRDRTYGVELRYSKGLSNAVDENANGDARNDVLAVIGSIALQ